MSENEGLLLQSEHFFEIDTTPEATETWARVGAGLDSFEVAMNEEVDQTAYLDGGGFASTDVTGAQMTIEFSGHRKYGDPAQDYIFGLQTELGKKRKTRFRWTSPSGKVLVGPCTIAEIEGPGGEASSKGEISFQIHFNGKPVIE